MPDPCCQVFKMIVYVDCDIGVDCVTQRSRTGFAIFLNRAPIYWISAKQHSCEVSTFVSELKVMKQAVEHVRGLRYKVKMMRIQCEDPVFVYGDNKLVLANTTGPASTLKKNMNILSYHFVCEGCTQDANLNLEYLLTKPFPSREKRWGFVRIFLYWL